MKLFRVNLLLCGLNSSLFNGISKKGTDSIALNLIIENYAASLNNILF